MTIKKLLSGNEAIARGAYEYGVRAATGYPGTPSTEILENIVAYPQIYAEWAPNEKVAVEVAEGTSFAGARTIVTMKHVGVNVAADPLFTLAYTGVNGGFMLVTADDPGMHSSQDEQDNRYYAKFMKIPLLEPSDSQEAKDFVGYALDLSEQFDTPVMLRVTTRISHSKGIVTLGERTEYPLKPYEKNVPKYVVVPANARKLRVILEERLTKLADHTITHPANRMEEVAGTNVGVITSGISYQYAKEALHDNVSYLKLGFSFPLPTELIAAFVAKYETVYVVEEGEPFLEEQIKALGIKVIGKEVLPHIGEMTPAAIRKAILGQELLQPIKSPEVPMRPPVLCPSCPHRGVYYVLNKLGAIITGDIGCYALGVMPPLNGIDTCICMGASIGNALGFSKILPDRKVVATIGDSTFLHSGITGLMDVVYNKGIITTVILDNSITGMTGHQHNPATGYTIKMEPTRKVDLEAIVRACGVEHVAVVDAYDLSAVEKAVKEAMNSGEPSVVITRKPCVLIEKHRQVLPFGVIADSCKKCKMCMKLGCPAIQSKEDSIVIDANICNACGVCAQVCKFDAIKQEGGQNE
jgi:indolepyruvate ferredoxin oxidoreductase, alpha subunit